MKNLDQFISELIELRNGAKDFGAAEILLYDKAVSPMAVYSEDDGKVYIMSV